MSPAADGVPDYQFLLARANVFRQQHQNAQALTSFAQASNAGGEDQAAEEGMLQAGADEGLRITPNVSLLSDFSVQPIFEDTTVYVLDSKLDSLFPVPSSDTALLPQPRSSLETQGTAAFHLHLGQVPTGSGFFQVRNARGQISVPSISSIVNRNTTDYTFNFGLNPTLHLGNNVLTFNSGIQGTVRRDSSVSGSNEPESLSRLHLSVHKLFLQCSLSQWIVAFRSRSIHREQPPLAANDGRSSTFVSKGPWGKTALVTGWGPTINCSNP